MAWKSRAEREHERELAQVQTLLLAGRLTGDEALERRAEADRAYATARAIATTVARRRARLTGYIGITALVGGLAAAAAFQPAWSHALLGALGALVLTRCVSAEDARMRRALQAAAGHEVSRLLLFHAPVAVEPHEGDYSILSLDVKNLRALEEGLSLSELADLSATIGDFFARIGAQQGGIGEPYRAGKVRMCFRGTGASHTRAAVEAALAAQAQLRAKDHKIAGPRAGVHVGIGVHSGQGIWGAIGSVGPVPVTCLGPVADLASELSMAASWDEVIVSDEVALRLEGSLRADPREPLHSASQSTIVRIWAAQDLLPER